jgi:hypothetical protein
MCDKVKCIRCFHKFQKSDYWVCRGCPLATTEQIQKIYDICRLSQKLYRCSILTKYLQWLHKKKCTFNTIFISNLLRIKNFKEKFVDQFINHIFCSIKLFWKKKSFMKSCEKCAIIRHRVRDNIIRRMRVACWLDKFRITQPEYVKKIQFPRQHQLYFPTTMSFL